LEVGVRGEAADSKGAHMLNPASDRDVIHGQAALRHDLLQIAVAQRIPQVLPHAEEDEDIGEVSPPDGGWASPAHDIKPEAPKL